MILVPGGAMVIKGYLSGPSRSAERQDGLV